MASLLARAEQLKKLLKDQEDIESIPLEEREKIYKEIDQVVAFNKLKIQKDTFSFKSRKNDIRLPLIINLGTLFVIGVASFGLFHYFDKVETFIISDHEEIVTVESKLIETLRKESLEQLDEKEAEILSVQNSLNKMHLEQEKLIQDTQNEIASRENELRVLFDTELESERQRLSVLGYSDTEIEEWMDTFIEEKEREYSEKLSLANRQIEEERAAREATITSLISEYESTLGRAEEESLALEESLNQRYQRMEEQLQEERDEAVITLSELSRKRNQEQFVLNNIHAMYKSINDSIKMEEYSRTAENISALESYLNREDVLAYEAVQFRRDLDIFMIHSLRKLIAIEQKIPDTVELVESAGILSKVTAAVEEGNRYYEAGEMDLAKGSYLAAISSIPTLDSGYTKLQTIEEQNLRQERLKFLSSLEEGDRDFSSRLYEEAIDQYRQALEYLENDSDVVSRIVNQLVEAGVALKTASGETLISDRELEALNVAKLQQDSRLAVIEGLSNVERTMSGETPANKGNSREELANLLNTKLLIMEVLASDSIQNEYPDLHKKMGDYLEAYGQEKENSGREAALEEILQITRYLSKDTASGLPSPEEKQQKELFLQFLQNLKNILELEQP